MPSKKSIQETKVSKKDRSFQEEEGHFLEEDDEEEEIDYLLAENAEEKVEEALQLLGAPSIDTKSDNPQSDKFPTETHLRCRVEYTRGDVAPPFAETLILRKP